MSKSNTTVAKYITQQLALCGKTQGEVAHAIGYDNANVLTMFKQGKTKVPVNKVKALAVALEVDPIYLLRLVMTEYMPDTWEVIQNITNTNAVSGNEANILNIVRNTSDGLPVEPITEIQVEQLKNLVKDWAISYNKAYESNINAKVLK